MNSNDIEEERGCAVEQSRVTHLAQAFNSRPDNQTTVHQIVAAATPSYLLLHDQHLDAAYLTLPAERTRQPHVSDKDGLAFEEDSLEGGARIVSSCLVCRRLS